MKKITKSILVLSLAAIATFVFLNDAEAARVLDYTYNCVGSGGNCLPDVVVKG